MTVFGGERAVKELELPSAPSLSFEYGDARVTLEIVSSVEQAIDYINKHGSGHTDCVVTEDATVAQAFLSGVDSACTFHNASTRQVYTYISPVVRCEM